MLSILFLDICSREYLSYKWPKQVKEKRYLLVDYGNTFAKAAVFQDNKLVNVFHKLSFKDISLLITKEEITQVLVSKVGSQNINFSTQVPIVTLNHQLPLPIKINYDTPATLGADRIAAVVGADVLFPNQNNLVIDMGTCITYDFITKDKEYLGGGISLGVQSRFRAMHEFTAKLPLIPHVEEVDLIGKDTLQSMKSGVYWGVIGELNQIIQQYKSHFTNFNTIICGGDAPFFESKLKETIFVRQNLIFIGLNRILEYYVANC